MNLTEFFQQLCFGPLSDISPFNMGTLDATQKSKVTLRLNTALVALYTRFQLKKKTLVLQTYEGIHTYNLRKDFALTSGSSEPVKYIIDDVANPFNGDLLQVVAVYNSEHCEQPLNDRKQALSWFTPSWDQLKYDYPVDQAQWYVDFNAAHDRIPLTTADPDTTQILIPASLEEALLCHVAGNIMASMNIESALIKAQALLGRYESLCVDNEYRNTNNTHGDVPTNTGFEQKGFV